MQLWYNCSRLSLTTQSCNPSNENLHETDNHQKYRWKLIYLSYKTYLWVNSWNAIAKTSKIKSIANYNFHKKTKIKDSQLQSCNSIRLSDKHVKLFGHSEKKKFGIRKMMSLSSPHIDFSEEMVQLKWRIDALKNHSH